MHRYILQIVIFLIGLNGERRFIAIGDHEFEGEDPVLQAELARRMASGKPLDHIRRRRPPAAPAGLEQAEDAAPRQRSARRTKLWEMFVHNRFLNWGQPNVTNFIELHLHIMRQAIYSVEGSIKTIDGMVEKFEDDIRFKISYSMAKVHKWRFNMHSVLQQMIRNATDPDVLKASQMTVLYMNLLRWNIDITYSVDYIFQLHNTMTEAIANHNRIVNAQFAKVAEGGGMPGMGGMPGQGGRPGMGGMPGQGGRPGMGGMPGQGGRPGMGGMPGQGGMPGTG